jgi:hypothetical protein
LLGRRAVRDLISSALGSLEVFFGISSNG